MPRKRLFFTKVVVVFLALIVIAVATRAIAAELICFDDQLQLRQQDSPSVALFGYQSALQTFTSSTYLCHPNKGVCDNHRRSLVIYTGDPPSCCKLDSLQALCAWIPRGALRLRPDSANSGITATGRDWRCGDNPVIHNFNSGASKIQMLFW